MPIDAIQNQQTYAGQTFKHVDLKTETLEEVEFSECTFIRCDFSEAVLRNCRLIDCAFEKCVLRLTEVPGSTCARVRFRECDLPGVNWSDADWSGWATKTGSLSFDNCNLRYCIFFGLTLTDFTLTDCNAHEVNFAEATLKGADFSGTDFSGTVFLRTDLTEANFAGATRYTLNLDDNITTDAKFALPEAIRLLHTLDIILVDPATDSELDAAQLDDFIG
jgi:uncharacterized protein YjbI with pentapeptide repeats